MTDSAPAASVEAVVAWPGAASIALRPTPGVLVVHEVFGVTPYMRRVVTRLAGCGYATVMPDLYARDALRAGLEIDDIERSIAAGYSPDPAAFLDAEPVEQRVRTERALAWRQELPRRDFLSVLDASASKLRSLLEPGARIAAVGFCMGGGLLGTYLAEGSALDGAVVFYGTVPASEQVGAITCPILGHYGGLDTPITGGVPAFEAAMAANDKSLAAYVYPEAPHAFANDDRASYRADAAALAWSRTESFLERVLTK